MPSVEFHPEAQAELTAATEWYLERSLTAAANFVVDVEHAVKQIGEAPLRYPQTLHGRRRFVLLNFPYDLVYRSTGVALKSSPLLITIGDRVIGVSADSAARDANRRVFRQSHTSARAVGAGER